MTAPKLDPNSLLTAVENNDATQVQRVLKQGISPLTRRHYGNIEGETVAVMAVRCNAPAALAALLEAGAPCEGQLAFAASLLVERCTRTQVGLENALALVELLESHQADWGCTDPLTGGGQLRAIDILAGAQPQWAQASQNRMGLIANPMASQGTFEAPAAPARRRAAR